MLATRRRTTAGLIAAALVVGVAGVTSPAVAAEPTPGADLPRLPVASAGSTDAPTGNEPLSLVVGLKPGADRQAPAEVIEKKTDVEVVDTDPVKGLDAVTVEVAAGDRAEAVAALQHDKSVEYVEVNNRVRAFDITPDDPYFVDQWGLHRTAVPAAWETTTGDPAVTVAVVDTGVTEVSEIAGRVLPGYDFFNGDTDATDDDSHGTLIATQIAAAGDDGKGIAGICWTCRILPVKVLGSNGEGFDADVAAGIIWAADEGVDVINLSLGGPDDSRLLREAVAYAAARNILVVAAAGNEGTSRFSYPAAIPSVLAVGASNKTDGRDVWSPRASSNFGANWVDVAAPGCNVAQSIDQDFYTWCGTSSAAPVVVGVAALALSARPGLSATKLRNLITNGARPLGGNWVANGRVRANVTVLNVSDDTPPTATAIAPAHAAKVRGRFFSTLSGVTDVDSGIHRAELWANGTFVGRATAAPYRVAFNSAGRNGVQVLQWRVYDRAGNRATYTRRVIADNAGPTVKITAGPKNQAKVKGTVTLKASASDPSGVAWVQVLVNGKVIATDRAAPYTFKIKVSKYAKTMKVRVRAYDKLGNFRYVPTRTWKR